MRTKDAKVNPDEVLSIRPEVRETPTGWLAVSERGSGLNIGVVGPTAETIRRAALMNNVPHYTTIAGAEATVGAIAAATLWVGGTWALNPHSSRPFLPDVALHSETDGAVQALPSALVTR